MARNNITVGIDVGSSRTKIVVIQNSPEKGGLKILAAASSETGGLKKGYIIDINQVAAGIKRAVAEAERVSEIKIKQATISVGGITLSSQTSSGSSIISRADKEITEIDVDKAIDESEKNIHLVNQKIIHLVPLFYKLDGKEVLGNPLGMQGVKLETKVIFVTYLEQHIEDLVSAARLAGIEISDVIAAPLAASLATLSDKEKRVGCILIDIGAEVTSIAVFENGNLMSLEVIPIGSTDITNDIALGLKIPLEEAERVKTGSSGGDWPEKKVDHIIEARLSDIFDLIEAHLKKIGRNKLLPAGAILVGGGARIPLIEEFSKKALDIPSRVGSAKLGGKNTLTDPSWFVALGLCIAARETSSVDLAPLSRSGPLRGLRDFFSSLRDQLMP